LKEKTNIGNNTAMNEDILNSKCTLRLGYVTFWGSQEIQIIKRQGMQLNMRGQKICAIYNKWSLYIEGHEFTWEHMKQFISLVFILHFQGKWNLNNSNDWICLYKNVEAMCTWPTHLCKKMYDIEWIF